MLQLRFIVTLCLSISLVLGQLSCVKCTYASFLAEQKDSFKVRQRKGESTSLADKIYEVDVEKADFKRKFREENKGKLDTSIRYAMTCFVLFASYMMLWNFTHTPKVLSSSRPYDPEDYRKLYNQQRSFTNSGAFNTLQYFILLAAVGVMIKCIYTLWQVKDTLPSPKELKQKAGEGSLNIASKIMYGIFQTLKVGPKLWRAIKAKSSQEVMPVVFRPTGGSTTGFDYNFTLKDKLVTVGLTIFGGMETSIVHRVFKPVSPEFRGYLQNPPQAFSAKKLILDLSGYKFCDQDFSHLITFSNLVELRLRGSHLTEEQLELLKLFGCLVEVLDIRDNKHIKVDQLKTFVFEAVGPQSMRGAKGFENLHTILCDSREDLICEEKIFSEVRSFASRKVRVKGELIRKEELGKLFDRNFYYFNQAASNSNFPPALEGIIGDNLKRRLQESYIEKGYLDRGEIKYTRLQKPFKSIREVMGYIDGLISKDVFYLIEYDNHNKPVLYVSTPQETQPSDDSPSEPGLKSFKQKYFRVTEERIFAETLRNCKTPEESIKALEEDVQSENLRGTYLIEYDSTGQKIFYGSYSVYQYHDQNDIWFTPSTIYLPNEFKDHYDLRLYLRARHRIYKIADPDSLLPNQVKTISPFVKVDLRDEFVVLADELKPWVNPVDYPSEELEKLGLLTEIRLIETLARCGFLKSLQLDNLN